MVGPPFLMLTLLTLMLPLRATLTLLSGCCNIFASYNAKLAVFFKFRFAFVVSCKFCFNDSGYAGIDGLSRIVDIRASAARIGIPRIGITRFSAACIRCCRIVVLLFVGDFFGTGILIVRADGPVAAAIVSSLMPSPALRLMDVPAISVAAVSWATLTASVSAEPAAT